MTDVFISYAREDGAQAERIARGLEAMGLSVFWDNEIPPGQTWADYIEGKLNQCAAAVVLWSEHSTKSQWVREEARMGRSKLIPAKLDASEPPFGFGDVQAADLSAWGGDYNHPQWGRFANAVFAKARDGAAPRPAPPPPPAGGWQAPPQQHQSQQQQQQQGWQTPPPNTQQSWSGSQSAGAAAASPIEYIKKCLRLLSDGKGRARRAEYWWFFLFVIVVSIVVATVEATLFGVNPYTGLPNSQLITNLVGYGLLAAVASRRFHDVGLSGWLVAPAIGISFLAGFLGAGIGSVLSFAVGIAWLIVTLLPTKPGPNQYGPDPKAP